MSGRHTHKLISSAVVILAVVLVAAFADLIAEAFGLDREGQTVAVVLALSLEILVSLIALRP